jgi:hypothetical protein
VSLLFRKCGNFGLSQPYGPGIALLLLYLFNGAKSSSDLELTGWLLNKENRNNMKGSVVVLHQQLLGGNEQNHKNREDSCCPVGASNQAHPEYEIATLVSWLGCSVKDRR